MKKTYINPTMMVHTIATRRNLMTVSQVEVSTNVYVDGELLGREDEGDWGDE